MNRISELRKAQKLSQKALGEIIGVAQNTVCNWENGKRDPDYESLKKLALFFDCSTDYLLGHEKKPTVVDDGLTEMERVFLSLPPARREEVLRFMEYQASQSSDE